MECSLGSNLSLMTDWLNSQNNLHARCAKKIILCKSVSNLPIHLSEITDWLAEKSLTTDIAGSIHSYIVSILNSGKHQ